MQIGVFFVKLVQRNMCTNIFCYMNLDFCTKLHSQVTVYTLPYEFSYFIL